MKSIIQHFSKPFLKNNQGEMLEIGESYHFPSIRGFGSASWKLKGFRWVGNRVEALVEDHQGRADWIRTGSMRKHWRKTL